MKSDLSTEEITGLIADANSAMNVAYAPYSEFRVGAAVLMRDGQVFKGCNVENASFGATICAERSAIAAAVSTGAKDIRAICVTNTTDVQITPCGICRQVIYEFNQNTPVICCDKSGSYKIFTISELLPHAFTL